MAHPTTIRRLLRHSARWAIAAMQDEEPMIRALHANYAMGYIIALREVASDCEVWRLTGVDPFDVFNAIVEIQDSATHQVAMTCPHLIPQPEYLAQIAGEA